MPYNPADGTSQPLQQDFMGNIPIRLAARKFGDDYIATV